MALLSFLDRPRIDWVNSRVHEQPVAAVLGVGAHHRVEGGEQLLVELPLPLVTAPGVHVGGEPGVEVDGDQGVAHGPHRLGQPIVGVLQAGPLGIAADFRSGEHVEDRPERRGLEKGHIGVPPAGPVLSAVDGQHLGAPLDGWDHRVAFGDLAELSGEVGLLGGGELLVAEEDHVVGVERPADIGDCLPSEWL